MQRTTAFGTAFGHVAAVALLAVAPVAITGAGRYYTGLDMITDSPCLASALATSDPACLVNSKLVGLR